MKRQIRRSKKSSPTVSAAGDDVEQHYEKRTRDLESENEALKREIEELKCKLADVTPSTSLDIPNHQEDCPQKSSARKELATSLRKKPDTHSLESIQKHRGGSATKQISDDVQKLKAQKVKLQCKIKLDSVHFRLCKASLEKEILRLKKEQRKREFEISVLLALNRRQSLILQRRKAQGFAAGKQLQRLLESGKVTPKKNNGAAKENNPRIQDTKTEIELTMRQHELHSDYERQMKEISEEIKRFRLEADLLKAELMEDENPCSSSKDNQVTHTPIDSELKDLKEEFSKLSTLVSQMEVAKLQLSESDRIQSDRVEYSDSTGNKNDQSNMESSPSENSQPSAESSQETLCTTEESKVEVCCTCTRRSSCKTPKCKCRAMGSNCGESCGCSISKCANREAGADSNRAIQSVNAVENATCPEVACGETQKPPKISHEKESFKRPLRDIGNTLVNSYAGKAGPKKKEQKPVAQKQNQKQNSLEE